MKYDLGQLFVDVLLPFFFRGEGTATHRPLLWMSYLEGACIKFSDSPDSKFKAKNFLAVPIAVSAKQSQCRFLLTKFIPSSE